MKIDQLNYFLEVANTGHLGKAAKILNISPSAISHSIAQLEEELGQELFFREHKKIFLSSQGKLLQKRVADILLQVRKLKEEVSVSSAKLSGHFRIGSNAAFMDMFIPHWSKLVSQNEDLTGEIYSLRSGEILTRTTQGELDLGFCFSPEPTTQVNIKVLKRGNLIVAVRREHPILKIRNDKRIEEINRFPAVAPKAYKGIENCEKNPALKKLGINSRIQTIFESYAVAISLLETSDVWALIPDFILHQNEKKLVNALPTCPSIPYSIAAVWPAERPLLKPLQLLLNQLEN